MTYRPRTSGIASAGRLISLTFIAVTLAAGCSPPGSSASDQQSDPVVLKQRLDAVNAEVSQLDARVKALESAAQTSKYTLTQTWLVPDQRPSTSQTTFSSSAACEAARNKALADATAQAAAERTRETTPRAFPGGGTTYSSAAAQPTLNAVCST